MRQRSPVTAVEAFSALLGAIWPEGAKTKQVLNVLVDFLWEVYTKDGYEISGDFVEKLMASLLDNGWVNHREFVLEWAGILTQHPLWTRRNIKIVAKAFIASCASNPEYGWFLGKDADRDKESILAIVWLNDFLREPKSAPCEGMCNTLLRWFGEKAKGEAAHEVYLRLLKEGNRAYIPLGEGIARRVGIDQLLAAYSSNYRLPPNDQSDPRK